MVADELDIKVKQYELYLNGIEQISNRRGKALGSLVALNSAYFTCGGIILQFTEGTKRIILLCGLCLLGILTSIIFFLLLRSYRQLNSAKFRVLHKIEEQLPLQPYTEEWNIVGKGNDRSRYWPFSHLEKWMPIVFGLVYFIVLIVIIFDHVRITID